MTGELQFFVNKHRVLDEDALHTLSRPAEGIQYWEKDRDRDKDRILYRSNKILKSLTSEPNDAHPEFNVIYQNWFQMIYSPLPSIQGFVMLVQQLPYRAICSVENGVVTLEVECYVQFNNVDDSRKVEIITSAPKRTKLGNQDGFDVAVAAFVKKHEDMVFKTSATYTYDAEKIVRIDCQVSEKLFHSLEPLFGPSADIERRITLLQTFADAVSRLADMTGNKERRDELTTLHSVVNESIESYKKLRQDPTWQQRLPEMDVEINQAVSLCVDNLKIHRGSVRRWWDWIKEKIFSAPKNSAAKLKQQYVGSCAQLFNKKTAADINPQLTPVPISPIA